MTGYHILVVDDQPDQTEILFENLFVDDDRFSFIQAMKSSDFEGYTFSDYDAILLDINLDEWKTKTDKEMTLFYALAKIGNQCPVVLVSRCWENEPTHRRISEALASEKSIKFIATFVLNDLAGDNWKDYAESLRAQLHIAITKERQRANLHLSEDQDIHILHLSDPQYGDPGTDDWAEYVEDQIGQFVCDALDLEIHLIAVTGDISYSGQVSEFVEAEEKLPKLFEYFFPNRSDLRERILIVPGNHDVNLRLAAADQLDIKITNGAVSIDTHDKPIDGFPAYNFFLKILGNFAEKVIGDSRKKDLNHKLQDGSPHLKFALTPFRNFAWQLTGDPRWKEADELNWVNDSFKHIGLRFFLLNSVSNLDCISPQKAGFKQKVLSKLKGKEQDQPFGIAFSHHGPPEKVYSYPDILDEWSKTAGFLNTRGIKLFIHGHGHERKVDKFHIKLQTIKEAKGTINKDEILRVMAPTTHLDGKKRPDGQLRGFNIITLHRGYGKVTGIEVASYEFGDSMTPAPMDGSPWKCVV